MRFLMTSIKRVTVWVCVFFSDAEKIYYIKGSLTVRRQYCKSVDFWNIFYYWAFLLLSPANCGAMTGNEGRRRRRIMCNKGWPWYQEKIRLFARATTIWRNASARKDFSGTPSASILPCLKHYNTTWDSTALQKWILYFPTGQITATCVMKPYKIKVPSVFLVVLF